ncbi:MAG TPA: ABC transporter permease [Thermoguttaceae bacterium]|nr:ABC transporter permease [Thermoguttaceae bacterium]
MSHSIFLRLLWKEYRLQRAFWISMVVLAVFLHLIVLASVRTANLTPEAMAAARTTWVFEISLALAALYALGCGATLFATEHEADTYQFQRSLPVSARRLFFSKGTFAVTSTMAIIGLLWGLAAMMAGGRLPEQRTHLGQWGLWGFGTVELLVWGTFFSLVLRRPLAAAVLAIVCASVSVHFVVTAFGPQWFREPYIEALPMRVVFVGMLAVVTVWLGHRWFRERLFGMRKSEDFQPMGEVPEAPMIGMPRPTGTLTRLVWQHVRQSAAMLAILSAMVAPLCLTGFWLWAFVLSSFQGPGPLGAPLSPGLALAVMAATIAVPLAGASVFLGDQRRRGFRFLTERGVSPRQLWLSRQLVWAVPVLLWTVLILPVSLLPAAAHSGPPGEALVLVAAAFGFLVLAYPAGQLSSMLFSSGILAGFFSVALTLLLCVWAALMAGLGVPWLWSVAPIPVVLLLATFVRTPNWLLERKTLRAWLPTALTLAVPAVAIVIGACAHRVYSIPLVDPGFDVQAFAVPPSAEARATVDTYRRALDLYDAFPKRGLDEKGTWRPSSGPSTPLTEADLALLDQNEAVLDRVLAATERPCDFFDPAGRLSYGRPRAGFDDLGHLLVNSARRLESEGKLDAALDRYLAAVRLAAQLRTRSLAARMLEADRVERYAYDCLASWAAHSEQTADRIRDAIARLAPIQEQMPSPDDAIKSDHVFMEWLLAGDVELGETGDLQIGVPMDQANFFLILARRLPWESARAHRVMRLFTSLELEYLGDVESAVQGNRPVNVSDHPLNDLAQVTLSYNTFPMNSFYVYQPRSELLAWKYLRMETRRRAVLVQLALAGWNVEHGELPKRLEDLAGAFFDQLPMDPFGGRPFQYSREGQPGSIRDLDPWRYEDDPQALEPGADVIVRTSTPYFQSEGRDRRRWFAGYDHRSRGSDRDFIFPIPVGP